MGIADPLSNDQVRTLAEKMSAGNASSNEKAEVKAVINQAGSFGREIKAIVEGD